jgi:glycosyltransferase involved in cell wall biosynthesis
MRRVLIDGQVFAIQRKAGISKQFAHILAEHRKDIDTSEMQIIAGVVMAKYEGYSKIATGWFFSIKDSRRFAKVALFVNWFTLWTKKYDVIHTSHYFGFYLHRRRGTKHVVTIHDMIPEDFPEYFPAGNPHFQKARFIEDADRIICVSEFTKERVIHHYPKVESKCQVTYPGVDFSAMRVSENFNPSQAIYVGLRSGYKDFNTLLRALPGVLQKFPDFKLLCVGGGSFKPNEVALIQDLDIAQSIEHVAVEHDEDLYAMYRESAATIITSKIEGFGLPLIEAMANGCTVIAADIPVFQEIARDCYLPYPVGQPEFLEMQIVNLLSDIELNWRYRRLGVSHAAKFDWANTYQGALQAYRLA